MKLNLVTYKGLFCTREVTFMERMFRCPPPK